MLYVRFYPLALVGGDSWRLGANPPKNFTMLVVYRGLHCPICKGYLNVLDGKLGAFASLGVEVVAASSDIAEKAAKTKTDWGLAALPLAYGLPIAKARDWGLYVSKAIKDTEPAEFAEPGLFLIRPDQTLYAAQISTMPFARPSFDDLLKAVEFVSTNNYPARGEA